MQAVPGLMDHLDTLPGLSSDWTDASDSHEAQVLHCLSLVSVSLSACLSASLFICVCFEAFLDTSARNCLCDAYESCTTMFALQVK